MDNVDLFFQIFNLSRQNQVVDSLMIFAAKDLILLTILLVIASPLIGKAKIKKSFVLTLLSLIISFILVKIIRLFYFEPRPFVTLPITPLIKHIADVAFPSTHTTIMATIAFSFTFYKSKLAPIFLFFMLLIGFARIFVGVHYPLDILGGITVGLVSTFLAWQLKKLLKQKLFSI